MLYRTKSKDEKSGELNELREEFEGIYKKYKVNIIGFWETGRRGQRLEADKI